MTRKLFGTDGVRGTANIEPMTAETALKLGMAAGNHFTRGDHRHMVVIGKDTRLSGYLLEPALTAGFISVGMDVMLLGPLPTPAVAMLTRSLRADLGVMISASHNPYQDNGIKIFSRDGYKIPDDVENEIESLITTGKIKDIRPTADDIGKAHRIDDAIGRYIVFCKNTFPDNLTLEGLKIILDCANGATYKVAPIIFTELGAEVTTINDHPNGMNINDNCGALHPEILAQKVVASKADVGLAFDGDGDRLVAVDERGNILTGDHIMTICAKALKECGMLRNNLVIATPMSNFGFRQALRKMNIAVEDADVGDRYVLKLMREKGAVFGGEDSGHIIFSNLHTTGDGIISALQLLANMQETKKKLSKLRGLLQLAPQKLLNITVSRKPPLSGIMPLQEAISRAETELTGNGRILVRYSGTQPICRVMVESMEQAVTDRIADSLAEIVRKTLA
ncbi:MAG: phosphoglucosamine mutase [Phaeospirillum sp.]|nr:phosphoglucosamine mutase [Phaeospirillum sp.]